MNLLCISASNMINKGSNESTSYRICDIVAQKASLKKHELKSNIIELKQKRLEPCVGCGMCYDSHRCVLNDDFNEILKQIVNCDILFIIAAHYAPIPSKLSILLEKMEQITFLHWGKDNSYKSEFYQKPVGVISHGGGAKWALPSYKKMVNDTIANALDTIQLRIVPYNEEWNTGISIPVSNVFYKNDDIFPTQEYDWDSIETSIECYTSEVIKNFLNS